ncbi:SDR family oxidoreductase [Microbacterium sp. LRZ72]|uniref:SDR family oxidoreductase n=1 Tax=Microbacterium sp. LRZ72 TaxID=2942481 RepID=UPI0029BA6E2A|nr:SDR family oxidoreductase [Microbacterium sp. LRZ72]MDX2376838.1 SDR family oxidoreductase [Microbacterium sp. LRZ72]
MQTAAPTGREAALRAQPRADGDAPRALVIGSTGYVGGRLVPRLLAAGYRVRVLARNAERVASADWGDDVEVVIGDASDRDAVIAAVDDVDVLYYLVHSMGGGRSFEQTDQQAAQTVADAAASAGVGRLVYLGGLHPDDVPLSRHLRSRVEVGEVFLSSGVPSLVLQAGVVIGSGSASFEMVRHLTEVLPYMPAPKWVRNRIQPIAVRDVMHYLLGAARVDADVNRAVDIGGPDVLRYGQMMNGYAVEAGLRQRPIAALPVLTPGLASHWVNVVTPIPRSIARPLVESLQNECVVKNRAVDELIPPPEGGLTPYRRAVALALGRERIGDVETSWQDAAVHHAPSDPLPGDPDWAGRVVFTDVRSVETSAPAEDLWGVVEGIGGERGWYSWPLAWAVRGWMDKIVGGVGLRRGRRHPDRLAVGDALDFWRVEDVERGGASDPSQLRLRAEMKVPGLAWLEMRAVPTDRGARYEQRAVFFPRGLAGRLYWLAVLPFHGFIFAGMANRIVAAAETAKGSPA